MRMRCCVSCVKTVRMWDSITCMAAIRVETEQTYYQAMKYNCCDHGQYERILSTFKCRGTVVAITQKAVCGTIRSADPTSDDC